MKNVKGKRLPIFTLLMFGVFAMMIVGVLIKKNRSPKESPSFGRLREFSLIDSAQHSFTEKNLTGKIWVVNFIFTRCQGPCPILTQHMQRIYKVFFQDPRVHFLSISVDPLHDTPEVLASYAKHYLANPSRWHFVTALQPNALKALLLNGFRVSSSENPTLHTTQFVLMDTQNRIRGYFNGLELSEINALITTITKFLQSQQGSV